MMSHNELNFYGWIANYLAENCKGVTSQSWWYWFVGVCYDEAQRIINGAQPYTYEELAKIASRTQHNKLPNKVYAQYLQAHTNMTSRWGRTTCQTYTANTPETTPKSTPKSTPETTPKSTPETTPNSTPNFTPKSTPKKISETKEIQGFLKNKVPPYDKNEVPPTTLTYIKEKEIIKEKFSFLNTEKGAEWKQWAYSILLAGNGTEEEREKARWEHQVSLIALLMGKMNKMDRGELEQAQAIYGRNAGRLLSCMGNQYYLEATTLALMYGDKMRIYLDRHANDVRNWQGDKVQYVINGIEGNKRQDNGTI